MGIGKSKNKKEPVEHSSSESEPVKVSKIEPAGGSVETKPLESELEVRKLDLSISGEIRTRQSSDLSSPKKSD